MNLTKPICILDIEGTGLEVSSARIVSLSITRIDPQGGRHYGAWMFNPGFSMDPDVIEVHGITDEMVKEKPPFKAHAGEVLKFIEGSDLGGFNLKNYDVPLLWEEFYRSGVIWDIKGILLVDAGSIFKKFEERTLSAAVKFYCGREHKNAHDSGADVTATIDVLEAQIQRYGLPASIPELTKAGLEEHRVDLAGKIVLDRDGDYCYNFGPVRFNHKNRTGAKISHDRGLAEWALSKDFPMETKLTIRRILTEFEEAERMFTEIERQQRAELEELF